MFRSIHGIWRQEEECPFGLTTMQKFRIIFFQFSPPSFTTFLFLCFFFFCCCSQTLANVCMNIQREEGLRMNNKNKKKMIFILLILLSWNIMAHNSMNFLALSAGHS